MDWVRGHKGALAQLLSTMRTHPVSVGASSLAFGSLRGLAHSLR